jgi:hypothetical protein
MPFKMYIEALLADEDLADWVWELSDAGMISAELAASAWFLTRAVPRH